MAIQASGVTVGGLKAAADGAATEVRRMLAQHIHTYHSEEVDPIRTASSMIYGREAYWNCPTCEAAVKLFWGINRAVVTA